MEAFPSKTSNLIYVELYIILDYGFESKKEYFVHFSLQVILQERDSDSQSTVSFY